MDKAGEGKSQPPDRARRFPTVKRLPRTDGESRRRSSRRREPVPISSVQKFKTGLEKTRYAYRGERKRERSNWATSTEKFLSPETVKKRRRTN